MGMISIQAKEWLLQVFPREAIHKLGNSAWPQGRPNGVMKIRKIEDKIHFKLLQKKNMEIYCHRIIWPSKTETTFSKF